MTSSVALQRPVSCLEKTVELFGLENAGVNGRQGIVRGNDVVGYLCISSHISSFDFVIPTGATSCP